MKNVNLVSLSSSMVSGIKKPTNTLIEVRKETCLDSNNLPLVEDENNVKLKMSNDVHVAARRFTADDLEEDEEYA